MLLGSHPYHFVHLVSHAELVWDFLEQAPDVYLRRWPDATNSGAILWQFVEGVRWGFEELTRRGGEIERSRQHHVFELGGQYWASANRAACYSFVDVAMRIFQHIEADLPDFDENGVSGFWTREINRRLWAERTAFTRSCGMDPPMIDFQKLREACRLEWSVLETLPPSPVTHPDGTSQGEEADRVVVLRDPSVRPVVRGFEKDPLTRAQYDVVKALWDAGESGLSKDELDRKSKHGDAQDPETAGGI